MVMHTWKIVLLVLWFFGCTKASEDSASSAADGPPPTWHQDIRPIVESSCVSCHSEGGSGSFRLETYSDVVMVKDAVVDAIVERRMPPWKAVDGCTDYRDDISLSESEVDEIFDAISLCEFIAPTFIKFLSSYIPFKSSINVISIISDGCDSPCFIEGRRVIPPAKY